ncbi:GDSL family lipase [Flavobacterium sp. Leaf82]|jgi:lysophospholipase L1-like esterase|uniref:rhamnogalacturonan acetylesterase n=1 Tax=unclassified Flavobacterium TaxID=196869 RepID=UPI0006F4CCC9|nr:rhamnogalacturonan acetylesterase [Flavobacterium sp. Leaf82]KQO20593.1 GDSL family lipase [Flavobacterium sp. Leaf82]
MKSFKICAIAIWSVLLLSAFSFKAKTTTIYLIGDSTVADYSLEEEYQTKKFPQVGWGQMFQPFFSKDSLKLVKNILGNTTEVKIDDRAKGGRSTRTFFQEGRWAAVYKSLQKGDIVMMQFGHNDASVEKTERYVNIEGYKEFLRLFVNQSREKGATPIILTPVARNYPWKDGKLTNVHGEYPQEAKDVAKELNVKLIDLNELSMEFFSSKGQDFVTTNYFMNFEAGVFPGYPNGQKDNTHFQTAGGKEVAGLVFNAMKKL